MIVVIVLIHQSLTMVRMTVVYATVVTLMRIVTVTVSVMLQTIVAANVLVVTPDMKLTVIKTVLENVLVMIP